MSAEGVRIGGRKVGYASIYVNLSGKRTEQDIL